MPIPGPLEFDWDPDKAAKNVAVHGIAFSFATLVFLDLARAELDVSREADGEARQKTIGRIGRRLFTVVHTEREGLVRLISARRANRSEERHYGNR